MKCPNCQQEIARVRVYSECWQYATLRGREIVEYGSIEEVSDDYSVIECPDCNEDLTKRVQR